MHAYAARTALKCTSPSPQGSSEGPTLPHPAPPVQTALPCQRHGYGGATGGFVANFAQEVARGSCPCLWRGLGVQGVEQFGRSEAFVSLLDYQLPFLDHVHEFDADERGLRRVKRFEP
jgi:hypothetical protein